MTCRDFMNVVNYYKVPFDPSIHNMITYEFAQLGRCMQCLCEYRKTKTKNNYFYGHKKCMNYYIGDMDNQIEEKIRLAEGKNIEVAFDDSPLKFTGSRISLSIVRPNKTFAHLLRQNSDLTQYYVSGCKQLEDRHLKEIYAKLKNVQFKNIVLNHINSITETIMIEKTNARIGKLLLKVYGLDNLYDHDLETVHESIKKIDKLANDTKQFILNADAFHDKFKQNKYMNNKHWMEYFCKPSIVFKSYTYDFEEFKRILLERMHNYLEIKLKMYISNKFQEHFDELMPNSYSLYIYNFVSCTFDTFDKMMENIDVIFESISLMDLLNRDRIQLFLSIVDRELLMEPGDIKQKMKHKINEM